MLSSAITPQPVVPAVDESELSIPRRIRHITQIQIRNLTPYPVRDAVATALTQPAEQSQFPATGGVDDIGAILSRRHDRKASISSNMSRFNHKRDENISEQLDQKLSLESRGRRASTSSSKVQGLNASTSSVKSSQTSTSPQTVRSMRGHRARTNSVASFNNTFLTSSLFSAGEVSTETPSIFSDNSQRSLERIISSRMVETFITITIPVSSTTEPNGTDLPRSSSSSPPIATSPSLSQKRGNKSITMSATLKQTANTPARPKARLIQPKSAPSTLTLPHHTAPKQEKKITYVGAFSPTHNWKSVAGHPAEVQDSVLKELTSPLYFSPIHRPAINPIFFLDAQSGHDFPQHCDTSGEHLRLQVWSKVPIHERAHMVNHQQFTEPSNNDDLARWKLLDEKDIHLNELLALPNDLETNPSELPPNTVLITLSPPNQTFYFPQQSPSIVSRSSTPTGGYASDPESEVRKAKQSSNQSLADGQGAVYVPMPSISRRHRHQGANSSVDLNNKSKTASWQDLFKLVNLQSLILDNESSLGEVVQKINTLLEDEAFPMSREMSERESHIKEMRVAHQQVLEQIAHKKREIADRAKEIRLRSEMLKAARDALAFNPELEHRIGDETTLLKSLSNRMLSMRTSLISTLSTIFPIELYSPPDLLFTILDAPLPIPISPTDPAPPLSMSEHRDVTEDTVATALGYVSQVLQILAAYTGKNLTYPVTCIGSRSLIRDDISAMMGPRMFPLFSKGVDTYRFEYGVFLLNKDIEMLMSERDLRALDMRHTLPNLKNLLLTLSHDKNAQHQSTRTFSLTSTSPGLETPLRTPSPGIDDVQTPKPSHINLDTRSLNEGTSTPMASGTITPTVASNLEESRKQKSFLGFVPFTDFLRSRYPSTSSQSQHTGSEAHDEEDTEDTRSDTDSECNEEDRMTIHAPASEGNSIDTLGDGEGIVAET